MFIEPRGDSLSRKALDEKYQAALKILEQGEEALTRKKSVALAQIVTEHINPLYLQGLGADDLAGRVCRFLEAIESRAEGPSVQIFSIGAKACHLVSISPDVPYLLDSLKACLREHGVRFQVVCHPIFRVLRQQGAVVAIGAEAGSAPLESMIVLEVEDGCLVGQDLVEKVRQTLALTVTVEGDRNALREGFQALEPLAVAAHYGDFWNWLLHGNFIPFGYRKLDVALREGACEIRDAGGSLGLGFLPEELPMEGPVPLAATPRVIQQLVVPGRDVQVAESDRVSPVYRTQFLTCLGVHEPDGQGGGQLHIVSGLFTDRVDEELTSNIPPLRDRIEAALQSLGVPPESHDYRKTIDIFNSFPKVELFFLSEEELRSAVRSFSQIYRSTAVRAVGMSTLAVSGLTLILIMPRQYYSADIMGRIESYLCRFFKAPSASSRIIHMSSEYLSLHVKLNPERVREKIDLNLLENGLTNIATPWKVRLQHLLAGKFGDEVGGRLWERYRSGFTREYRTLVHPRFALRDISAIEKVLASGEEVFALWGPFTGQERYYRLQFYSLKRSYLNELMPLLENLNLTVIEEVDSTVPVDGQDLRIKSFAIIGGPGSAELSALREPLLEALTALRKGDVENDYLQNLLTCTGLNWREIDIFRGYRNYYFQIGSPYSKKRVAYALIHNPEVARLLYRYFEGRFADRPEWRDPLVREEQALLPLRMEIVSALETVSDINEDDILRTLFNLIDSTVRTNFFVRKDRPDYFFSFKISAIGIIDMPAPRPLYEIYVHSATMEGIHLRGGKVARGGLRWSDRPDDFRTEVLGLMKTQMTKNALIVPVGSKGGFVVKTPFTAREEGLELSKAAYQTLIRGLLDVTDNRVGDEIVRPPGVVAYDEVDPYLVVAADKGTAHLPDTANAVSRDYGFWLDDAFASGGSQGYDHKKLGITARGAWECVKRHFREMGIDTQTEPFTVVGIGDMSGDVFGNGMLLSRKIRLLAAFNHRHIFLDPEPDPESSYAERQRLFELPRSSWDDYDQSLISEGGGVFPRDAKEIPLSPQVRSWLGVRHETMDAAGLIRLLLASEVDLLWNGGIGTYVKASTEKQEDAGDRANDSLRIDAVNLRAKVVGEGGNLGLTQRGRIEYALHGGRIYTDAVDNSAGVDCSDHEVNLKIFMQHLRQKGAVASQEERDRQLEEVTGEVCQAVLDNNYGQSLCLSLDAIRCRQDLDAYLMLADRLAQAGLMDRRGEFLPSAKEVLSRENPAFVRPELAILMAYSKMQMFQALLASELPDLAGMRCFLDSYFPGPIRERYRENLGEHPLAREIIATVVTNSVIDQAGSAFFNNLSQKLGLPLVQVVSTYLTFDRVLESDRLRLQIYALDNQVSSQRQHQLLLRLENTLARLCAGAFVQSLTLDPESSVVEGLKGKVLAFEKALGGIVDEQEWLECKAFAEGLEEEGFTADVARRLAILPYLDNFLPIISLEERTGNDLYSVAQVFHEVRTLVGLDDLLERVASVPVRDKWDRNAQESVTSGFSMALFRLTLAVLEQASGNLEAYLVSRRRELQTYHRLRDAMRSTTPVNFHPFLSMVKAFESLIG